MGLFDVIRYPVGSIFSHDEVAVIPLEITLPWAEECFAMLGEKIPTEPATNLTSSLLILYIQRALLRHAANELIRIRYAGPPDATDALTEFFHRQLLQRIKDA